VFVVPEMGSAVRAIGGRTFDFSRQVAVMGIVNRTRDSFYDRGATFGLDAAVAAAERAVADGADWVDVGAVPFSPLAGPVSTEEEIDRLLPVVAAIRARSSVVISVDTYRAAVARAALAAGADAVNDTSGLHDPEMAATVAAAGATLVVTHSRARPGEVLARPAYRDVVAEVAAFLVERAEYAQGQGVARDRIVVDPGHDLNKNTEHSLELTRRLDELATLGYPLLASVSNKDFLQETLDRPATGVTEGTIAAVVLCVAAGARIVRVHDVAAVGAAVRVVEAVQGWRRPVRARHNR
jgi:dihydropteroate synthase